MKERADGKRICRRPLGRYIILMTDNLPAQITATSPAKLHRPKKSLEDRLNEIALPSDEVAKIAAGGVVKTIRDTALGFVPCGEAIKTLISYSDDLADNIKQQKKERILEGALDKLDHHGDSLSKIAVVLGSPYGSALFSKILQIADNSPPDADMLGHLSAALAHISDTDFIKLFDEHKFALGLLERLSTQSLTIASDYGNWPTVKSQGMVVSGNRVTSDWQADFAKAYASQKGISDAPRAERVLHSVRELSRDEIMQCLPPKDLQTLKPTLTPIGRELAEYLHYK